MSECTYEAVEVNYRNLLDIVEAVCVLRERANLSEIVQYSDTATDSAEKALKMAIQLKLVKLDGTIYKPELPFARLLTNARINEKKAILKFRLMEYEPFKFFVSLILRGEDITRAALKTKTAFNITGSTTILKNSLLDLGIFSRVFIEGETGIEPLFKEEPDIINVFSSIENTINDQTQIESFVTNQLDDAVIDYIGDLKERLVSAGAKFSSEPKSCIMETADVFEDFLKKCAQDESVNISRARGFIEIGNKLRSSGKITKKHQGFIYFVGQMRNAFKHTLDSEVNKSWQVSDDLPLEVFLVTLTSINSIFFFIKRQDCIL
jgi:hypothetical protein